MELNNTIKTILERKSVRSFENKPIGKEQLELILKAGMAAPSARNLQPWAFIVITDRNTLNTLADRLPYAKMLYEVSAAVVVCGVPENAGDSPEGYWVQDCSAATQNMLLAIESMGLGAVWTGVYPRPERVDVVREILSIPKTVFPLNVIPVGYPKGESRPKDKFKPEDIRWGKW